MLEFLSICLGGAIGTGARYLLSVWVMKSWVTVFPYATLTVNLIGSFCLALLIAAFAGTQSVPPAVRLMLTVGLLGGFTTFSSFSCETMLCFQQGHVWTAALNVAASIGGCLVACVLGQMTGRWLAG
jgi:CrcB protein